MMMRFGARSLGFLRSQSGQAMIEYSSILMFMLAVVILFSGTSVMKMMIESLSDYFQATYFALQYPM
jgi:Flp pilus assembly pilin Flp